MNCPVCANALTPVEASDVMVDVCVGGCGGIWFDIFELQKLDQPQERAGEMLVTLKKRQDIPINEEDRRNCPRCTGIVMMRHFYSPRRRVEVDECPSCGGFWLDAGELALIRDEHATAQEQQFAVEQYLNTMSVSVLERMRAGGPDDVTRARRIGQLFQFSRPIRYERE